MARDASPFHPLPEEIAGVFLERPTGRREWVVMAQRRQDSHGNPERGGGRGPYARLLSRATGEAEGRPGNDQGNSQGLPFPFRCRSLTVAL